MGVVGCIARELATDIALDVAIDGVTSLLAPLFAGAEQAPPPSPPQPAVTVTHQIKHSSFLAALAGAVVGALASAAVYAVATAVAGALIVGTGGLATVAVVAIGVGATIAASSQISKLSSWTTELVESAFPADDGPVLLPSSPDVFIAGLPAARAGIDTVACVKHSTPPLIGEGSDSVIVNGYPLARIDDRTACGAKIKQGVETVLAGGEKIQMVDEIAEEFPWWQRAILTAVDYVVPPSKCMIQGLRKLPGALLKNGKKLASAFKNGIKGLGKGVKNALNKGAQLARQAANMMKAQFAKLKGALKGIWAGTCAAVDKCKDNLRRRFDNLKAKLKPNAKACPKDPVDASTGAVVDERIDFTFGHTLQFRMLRSYNSQRSEGGFLGRGWRDSLTEHLRLSYNGEHIEYFGADGEEIAFAIAADERVFNAKAPHYTLSRTATGFALHDLRDDRTRHFETQGDRARLVRIDDAHGNFVDIGYGSDGHLTTLRHSDGIALSLERLADDQSRTQLIVKRGDTTTQDVVARYVTASEFLVEAVSTTEYHFMYEYDERGRMARWADATHTSNTYEYDKRGRCTLTCGAEGYHTGSFEYDETTRVTRVRDSRGGTTEYRFDETRRLLAITNPHGNTESWAYDRNGQLIQERDATGNSTRYEHDPVSGLLTRTLDPEGGATEFYYDDNLRLIAVVDPAEQGWTYERDDRGAITCVIAPNESAYRYMYNASGQTTAIVRPDGATRNFTYDCRHRLTAESDWCGTLHRYTYDARDRLIESGDAEGRTDSYFYDPRDRLTALRRPDGHQVRFEYDSENNLVALTDENGHTARAEYGAFDLRRASVDAEGRRYEFSYDPDHILLTEVRAPDGRHYRLERDAAGRLVREIDYHGAMTRYDHDAAGRVTERHGAAGQRVLYRYNRRGEISAIEADGETTIYERDALGRVVRATNSTTVLEWTYDALGRVTRALQDGDVLEYTYDEAGRCITRTLWPGVWQKVPHTTHFGHDPNGNLTSLHLSTTTLEIQRDDRGLPTCLRTPEGFQLVQEHDVRGALTAQRLAPTELARSRAPDAAGKLSRTYTYDPAENPREIHDDRWGTTRYRYDKSDRVLAADRACPAAEIFRYGPAGLLAAAGHPDCPNAFDFGVEGRVHRVGDAEYMHDDAGRVISRTIHRRGFRPARWVFTWDSQDRLVAATTPDGQTWRYTYDPFGRRIRKFNPTTRRSVLYLWDGDVLLREIHLEPRGPAQDQQAVRVVYWHHEPGTFRPLAREEDGEARFVVSDHLGTPKELVTPEGAVTWRARHVTWGDLVGDPTADPHTCPIRFQGQYEDAETGLFYNRFRYYDPFSGAYVTPDPIGLDGGPQPRAYVDNPNSWVDPLGLAGCPTIGSRLRDAGLHGLPRRGKFRYMPPKGYDPRNPLPMKNGGYLDRHGNIWQEGPYHGDPSASYAKEWDVQLSETGKTWHKSHHPNERPPTYINVRPDGKLSH